MAFDFELTDEEMGRVAAMDTGVSVAFDHRDPAMLSQFGGIRSARDTNPAVVAESRHKLDEVLADVRSS